MADKHIVLNVLICLTILTAGPLVAADNGDSDSESLRRSLVYIESAIYSYSAIQPWRHEGQEQKSGYGCAVGAAQVLTTAFNVADAAFITVQAYGQSRKISAAVTVVDYESNLALLELDPAALESPLKPLTFVDAFPRGDQIDFHWLSEDGRTYSGRAYLDRAELFQSTLSYAHFLNYIVGNVSQRAGLAQLFQHQGRALGLGCWYDKDIKESGIIPAVTINQFLHDVADGRYDGFPVVGFVTRPLLDPARRRYLKMPATEKKGVYVSDVFTLGSGSDLLRAGDVILSIDGREIDAYGRYEHPDFGSISYKYLIDRRAVGEEFACLIWRDGKAQTLNIRARNFPVGEMLIPYYEYDRQSKYLITGGYVFQPLTRKYLTAWGSNWRGRVHPHLYNYYNRMSMKPTEQRREIVILSRVIPAPINLGYHSLNQLVVSTWNGMTVRSFADILEARQLHPEAEFDIVEFENDTPTLVIPRSELPQADAQIAQRYGIAKMINEE